MSRLLLLFGLFCFSSVGFAQFSKVNINELESGGRPIPSWGDYDNDGDLDVLIVGNYDTETKTSIYNYNNGSFTEVFVGLLPNVENGNAIWTDVNGDNLLDILIAGNDGTFLITRVYSNTGSTFIETNIGEFTGISSPILMSHDYNNDGKQDLFIMGNTLSTPFTGLYYHTNNGYILKKSDFSVGNDALSLDFDSDGDIDIVINNGSSVIFYINESGEFNTTSSGQIPGTTYGDISMGHFDNDGLPDLAISGSFNTKIYRNTGSGFELINTTAQIPSVTYSQLSWNDYTNNGKYELLLTGFVTGDITRLYEWNGTIYSEIFSNQFTPQSHAFVAPADFDADGDLDVLISSAWVTNLYGNSNVSTNNPPTPPNSDFSVMRNGRIFEFSWGTAVDDHSSSSILSYNIRIGTTPGGAEILAPLSNLTDGHNLLPKHGNCSNKRSFSIKDLSEGTYYWSVQAIDGTFSAGMWSGEQTFTLSSDFTEIYSGNFAPMKDSGVRWVDFNNDGQNDLIFSGNFNDQPTAKLYLNTGTGFTPSSQPNLLGTIHPSIEFSDFDKNGETDIIIAGEGNPFTVYLNQSGTLLASSLYNPLNLELKNGGIIAEDLDANGEIDFVLSGFNTTTPITKIFYHNSEGWVNSADLGINMGGKLSRHQQNSDGFVDIIVSENNTNAISPFTAVIAKGSSFFDDYGFAASINNTYGYLFSANFNSDLERELIISGYYEGQEGVFLLTYHSETLQYELLAPRISDIIGSIDAGDFDNDGDLDLIITGSSASETFATRIFENIEGDFEEVYPALPIQVSNGEAKWGDVDNDGDLDIVITGNSEAGPISKIYRNDLNQLNSVPNPPQNLTSTIKTHESQYQDSVIISWDRGSDIETPNSTLSYAVFLGTTSNNYDLLQIPLNSNGQTTIQSADRFLTDSLRIFTQLPYGEYFWKVASFDAAFKLSALSEEQTFVYKDNFPPDLWVNNDPVSYFESSTNTMLISGYCNDAQTSISTLTLHYRPLLSTDYSTIEIPLPSENTIAYSMNEDLLDAMGLEYYLAASDEFGNTTETDHYLVYRKLIDIHLPPLKIGNNVEDYNLFSIPYQLNPTQINQQIQIPYNPRTWRLFGYSNSDFQEYTHGLNNFEMGLGYWLIQTEDLNISFHNGTVFPLNPINDFQLPISEGWNLIGNPYPFTIDWMEVKEASGELTKISNLFIYNGGFSESIELPAYGAGFVFIDAGSPLKLIFPAKPSNALRIEQTASNVIDEEHWNLTLTLQSKQLKNEIYQIGVNSKATNGMDYMDLSTLPLLEDMASIEFNSLNSTNKLIKDIRKDSINQSWNFNLINQRKSSEQHNLLTWDNEIAKSLTYDLYLLNTTTNSLTDMKLSNQLALTTGQGYQISYGTRAFILEGLNRGTTFISSPYPNPIGEICYFNISIPENETEGKITQTLRYTDGRIISTNHIDNIQPGYFTHSFQIPFELKPGIYILQISYENETMAQSISHLLYKN